jgi:hypothetical protein
VLLSVCSSIAPNVRFPPIADIQSRRKVGSSSGGEHMLAALLLFQANAQPPLNLTCMGGGTANKPRMATIYGGGGSVNLVGQRQQGV